MLSRDVVAVALLRTKGSDSSGVNPDYARCSVSGDNLFAHAWARHDRAGEIADRMVTIWNDYIAQHPYSAALIGDGTGTYVLRIHEDLPLPHEFAVATGEWINHLRSALDYSIWALASHVSGRVPPPQQGQIQYPIYNTQAAWDRNLYRLDALVDHHRSMLLTMQPFSSDPDANYLGWVNRIARSDRHRHLSRMAGYLAELQPALKTPAHCQASLQWGERTIYDGYADAARIVITPWDEQMTIEVNPRMGIDPEIEEWSHSPFWSKIRFPERLRMLQVFVAGDIATYEYDATGTSRQAEMLTDSYKADCDSRPSAWRQPPRRTRNPVQWSDPVHPQRGSPSRLSGDDFPPQDPGSPAPRGA